LEIDLKRDLTARNLADNIDASYGMKTVPKTPTQLQSVSLNVISNLKSVDLFYESISGGVEQVAQASPGLVPEYDTR